MKKVIVIGAALAALAVPVTNAAAEPNERAACVGTYSAFFAHDGFGIHRSDVAQDFAHNAQPAGRNVYSDVAQFHGSLDDCFAQT
jgi:hypothetical protein